jgi:carbamoyl-phosphate synthase large subunit
MARVLVTGVGGNVGQGILKALAASGVASHVVGTDADPLSPGLYFTDKGYVVPRADSPAFADALARIIEAEKIDLVFVGADAETISLSRLKDDLETRCRTQILVSPPELVKVCHDKYLTSRWFAEQNLPHPPTVLANDVAGALALAREFGWPLILKPRTGFACRGILALANETDLMAAAATGEGSIIQRVIGTERQEYTATVFFDKIRQPRAMLVMRRDLLQGTSYHVEPCFDEAIQQTVADWACHFNALGPVNFQFRLTPQGPVCFEVNLRFSGTMGVRYHFGYNDAAMAVRHFVGGEDVTQPEIKPGVVLRYWEELFLPGVSCDDLRLVRQTRGGVRI